MTDPNQVWDQLGHSLRRLPRRRSRLEALRPSAVLVPLAWREGGLQVLLIRRPGGLTDHPGQVACPGGKLELAETPLDGALREAEEELGILPAQVEPLGALHDVEVLVSGYVITPWVGRVPPDLELRPDPGEVARAFYVPLELLADPARSGFELRAHQYAGKTYHVPYWRHDGELIWGATGRVLMDLLRLLYPEFPERSSQE